MDISLLIVIICGIRYSGERNEFKDPTKAVCFTVIVFMFYVCLQLNAGSTLYFCLRRKILLMFGPNHICSLWSSSDKFCFLCYMVVDLRKVNLDSSTVLNKILWTACNVHDLQNSTKKPMVLAHLKNLSLVLILLPRK